HQGSLSNDGDGGLRSSAVEEERGGDLGEAGEAHEDDEGLDAGESGPVLTVALGAVAGHDGEARRHLAVGDGDSRSRRDGDGARYSGDDLPCHARLGTGERLLGAATED